MKLSLLFWLILLVQFVLQMFLFFSLTTVVVFFPLIALSIGGFFLARIKNKYFWRSILALSFFTLIFLLFFSFRNEYFLWDIFCPENPDLILKCRPEVILYYPIQICFHILFWLSTLFVLRDVRSVCNGKKNSFLDLLIPYVPFILFWVLYIVSIVFIGKPTT